MYISAFTPNFAYSFFLNDVIEKLIKLYSTYY